MKHTLEICRKHLRLFGLCAALVVSGFFTTPVQAEDGADGQYNRVRLSAAAVRQVANDGIEVLLRVERQADDLAALNDSLNAVMSEAVETAGSVASVDVQTFPAGSWPQYDPKSRKLLGWRGQQQLKLTSDDFAATQSLLQTLQSTLAIAGITYRLSDAARDAVEDELIRDALLKLKRRGALVAQEMRMRDVRYVSMSVDTGDMVRGPMAGDFAMMARAEVGTAPAIEGGSSTVSVTVQAEIELLP